MLVDFSEREREGEREREISMWERNIDWLPLVQALNRNQTQNQDMCPDQESNLQHFGLWDDTHPTEPHRLGLLFLFKNNLINNSIENILKKNNRSNSK